VKKTGAPMVIVLVVFLLAFGGFGWWTGRADAALPAGLDPAIGFYTRGHNASYGGIDRWAFYGMRVERVVGILQRRSYRCRLPASRNEDGKLHGRHELVCDRQLAGLLARTLSIRAVIDYGLRGRLVAASAGSVLADDDVWHRGLARGLRRFGLIEPAHMEVRGFEVGSADLLAQQALDAIGLRAWHTLCEHEKDISADCFRSLRERRAHGFAALPAGPVQVIKAAWLDRAMERVRLMPAVAPGNGVRNDDNLLVRVADHRMWADFSSRDLTGRQLSVSIALDSAGGVLDELVARVGADRRTVRLSGVQERLNNGLLRYLVPTRGRGYPRSTVWVDLPNPDYPTLPDAVGNAMARADPAFARPLIKILIDYVIAPHRPEQVLQLYPALRPIERHAATLRDAHARSWLPAEEATAFIRQAYPDDAAMRASWALATCEVPAGHLVINAGCWQRTTVDDPVVLGLLRDQVVQLQARYATLGVDHPIWRHLARLAAVLAQEPPESAGADADPAEQPSP
jgi:hypothetical protein